MPKHEDKDAVTQLAFNFVCSDIRSFETVHGDGFSKLAQGLIDIGACGYYSSSQQIHREYADEKLAISV